MGLSKRELFCAGESGLHYQRDSRSTVILLAIEKYPYNNNGKGGTLAQRAVSLPHRRVRGPGEASVGLGFWHARPQTPGLGDIWRRHVSSMQIYARMCGKAHVTHHPQHPEASGC
eukprot:1156940-Pelagomonas_calceolata.AAC.7